MSAFLLNAARCQFSALWVIPYNLACHSAQLNRLDDSKEWFRKAMAIDEKAVKQEGIDGPDLNRSGTA